MNLKNAKTYRVDGWNYHYLISYDYGSGRKNRYNVISIYGSDLKVIGCELPLAHAKRVIQTHIEQDKEKDFK